MNQGRVILYVLCFLFFSCEEERSTPFRKTSKKYKSTLINLQHYFSDAEYNISFPVWFEDSLVKKNNIRTITRSIYIPTKELDESSNVLKELKRYHFNKNGELEQIEIEQYYEHVLIGSLKFMYKDGKDYMGFSSAKITSMSQLDEPYKYVLHDKVKYGEKYLAYQNINTGDYLFYMLNKRNWGPLSVDSILGPTMTDVVVLGGPTRPTKRYQVYNTVNETNVVRIEYDKSGDYPKRIWYDEYPFQTKRTILYNPKGFQSGYIDSTFSDNKYLTSNETSFEIKGDLILKLIQKKMNSAVEDGFLHLEKFDYSYYD